VRLTLIYPKWPKLPEQTEFHLPPHGPVVFAAALPPDVEVRFVDENRVELDPDDAPDVAALSVMLTCQVPRAKAIAAEYRRRGVPVVAGGIAVMLHAGELAQVCDAVFLGEAEGHVGTMLDDLRRGELRRVYDVMDRPPPTERIGPARREILDASLYEHRGVRMLDLVHASRGCRFNCAPCAVAFLGGRTFRPRPIDKVVEEVRGIDNNRLFFVDNSLAQDRAWEKELFTALIPLRKKFVSHPIEADDEILDLAYRAGSWYVYQAILGISTAIRDRVRRYHDHGIGVEGTIILGTDDHDRDGILRLLEFVHELQLDMAEFTVLTPFPHTSYREQLEREGRILHDRWEEYTAGRVVFQPKHLSPTELQDLYLRAWDEFYGPSGREEKMGRLFHNVVKRERADGTYVNRAAARRLGRGAPPR
jgi:radical SAM superfamily enzyme YgiQ (UPF0313 family)